MPSNNTPSANIDTGTILKTIGILLLLVFVYLIRDILALILAALFLAALLHPAASALARFRIPKGVTVLVLYVLLFGFAVLAVGLLLPPLIEQSSHLLNSLGKSWNALGESVQSLREFSVRYGLSDNLQAGVQSLQVQVVKAASGLFSTLSDVFGGLIGLVVVLVMAYYIVVQEDEARNAFRQFIPEEYQEVISTILKRIEEKISRWLLGQIALCLIIGILYFIGLSAIGIQSALVLALFGGFTEFIPYLGPILGAIPVFLIGMSESPVRGMLALGLVILIQQLENHVVVPKVMQRAVGINPLVSIIALLVGAKLFGFLGVLFAIPVATTISVTLTELYRFMRGRRA